MTSRRKRDLIERVRYVNELPELPYPPKLVQIPPPEPNYVSPVYMQRMAESLQLPVTVDAEAGMPIDLAKLEHLWLENGAHPSDMEGVLDWDQLDEDDAFLLSETGVQGETEDTALGLQGLANVQAQAANVTWLRRTEYLSAEQRKQKAAADAKADDSAARHDTSRPAQIQRILLGFDAANAPLSTLRNPSKPDVHAVDAYELLPDPETWATSFQVVRFASALGRANDPRLDTAILRPVTDPLTGQQRVSMYLPCADTLPQYGEDESNDAHEELDELTQHARENTAAARLKKRRRLGTYPRVPWLDGEEGGDANVYGTGFRHVRDLEPTDQPVQTDHLLAVVLDDEKPDAAPDLDRIDVNAPIAEQTNEAQGEDDDDLFGGDESMQGEEAEDNVKTTIPPQSAPERVRQNAVVTPAEQGRHVAYYHHIDMRYGLRIRRARKAEQRLLVPYEGFWHRVVLGNRPLTEREITKRLLVREGVDKLDLEGVEYVESEEELEHEGEVEQSAENEEADEEQGPEAEQLDAEVDGPEGAEADGEANEAHDEDGSGQEEDSGDDDDAGSDASGSNLSVDADELADLQAEAELHPDDAVQGTRRRRTNA